MKVHDIGSELYNGFLGIYYHQHHDIPDDKKNTVQIYS